MQIDDIHIISEDTSLSLMFAKPHDTLVQEFHTLTATESVRNKKIQRCEKVETNLPFDGDAYDEL
jgi:hypothetical protein